MTRQPSADLLSAFGEIEGELSPAGRVQLLASILTLQQLELLQYEVVRLHQTVKKRPLL